MAVRPLVVLVPGFLGFQRLGHLHYFPGVHEALTGHLRECGMDAEVMDLTTLPTSSIGARAARLAQVLSAKVGRTQPVHLVGHSTGGLDCRLVTTPGARIPGAKDLTFAQNVRTLVTVSSPHFGTPLASWLAGVHGHRLMGLLSLILIQMLRRGRRPIKSAIQMAKVLLLVDKLVGLDQTLFNTLYHAVIAGLPEEHAGQMEQLLGDVGEDQRLIEQLTPVSCELFNAGVEDRPGVRYGCVTTLSPPPKLSTLRGIGRDYYGQISHALYIALHRILRTNRRTRMPLLTNAQANALMDAYGTIPDRQQSDGIVPTLSQIWGEVVHATRGDHLDAMGFFRGSQIGPHVDWLVSGARFGHTEFHSLWHDVAAYIARDP